MKIKNEKIEDIRKIICSLTCIYNFVNEPIIKEETKKYLDYFINIYFNYFETNELIIENI